MKKKLLASAAAVALCFGTVMTSCGDDVSEADDTLSAVTSETAVDTYEDTSDVSSVSSEESAEDDSFDEGTLDEETVYFTDPDEIEQYNESIEETEEAAESDAEAENSSDDEDDGKVYSYQSDEILEFLKTIDGSIYTHELTPARTDPSYVWINNENSKAYVDGGYELYLVEREQLFYFGGISFDGIGSNERYVNKFPYGTYDAYLIYKEHVYEGKEQIVVDRDSEGSSDPVAEIYIEELFPDAF